MSNAKVGNAFHGILKVTRILTIILYVLLNVSIWYMVISSLQYFSVTDVRTLKATALVGLITILIPGILILILFVKKQNTIMQVVKIVIQVVLLVLIPFVFIIGSMASMAIPSSTTNPANYEKLDSYVEEKIAEEDYVMLPDTIPNNVDDIEFSYHYSEIFSDHFLDLEISYTYQNEEGYENEKARMQAHDPINKQVDEDGFQMYYTIGQDIEDEQNFRFGYDDIEKRVTYRIFYDWI